MYSQCLQPGAEKTSSIHRYPLKDAGTGYTPTTRPDLLHSIHPTKLTLQPFQIPPAQN